MTRREPAKDQAQTERFAGRDRQFAEHKKAHSDVSFGQYRAQQLYAAISSGRQHFSLGANLAPGEDGPRDFWTAGATKAEYYFRKMGLKPHHRVIDYGCGSLRIGAHFIRYLNRGCYFGLDVVPNFFEIGKELIGAELMERKAPRLEAIDEGSISAAAEFGADFVFSAAVCTHVHPEELQIYFDNLQRLTRKPGARLFLNAAVSDQPRRVYYDSWAWPLTFYRRSLPQLRLFRAPRGATRMGQGHPFWSVDLVFQRDQSSTGWRSRMRTMISKVALSADPRTHGILQKLHLPFQNLVRGVE